MCWTLRLLLTLTEQREECWGRLCKATGPAQKAHFGRYYERLANAVKYLERRHNEE